MRAKLLHVLINPKMIRTNDPKASIFTSVTTNKSGVIVRGVRILRSEYDKSSKRDNLKYLGTNQQNKQNIPPGGGGGGAPRGRGGRAGGGGGAAGAEGRRRGG